ncbi:MAG: tetratricopeptide repeat protein [Hyphomonadaceae bacterium]|nr:tetratricopeptide repeat protein [Hyphomonadaceae bacterium]
MSRAWLPRRFWAVMAALVAASAALAAPAASAQDPTADPRSVTVLGSTPHARRCNAALAEGDSSDRAVSYCERALAYPRLSDDAKAQLEINVGVMRMRRGEHLVAIQHFDAALALTPNHAEAFMNRGAAQVQIRDYGLAIASLTEALSLGVTEPHKAYFNRGVARESMGDLRGAFEDYTTALEIQPDWGPANAELARFARGRRENLANRLGETTNQ